MASAVLGVPLRTQLTRACLSQALQRLEVVPGDISQPDCGIQHETQERLLPEVDFVLHAAASIQFTNHVHEDLRLSYLATESILKLSQRMTRLRCFMYVSTAYSNSHCARGSTVTERLYPLKGADGQPADPAAIVRHLMQTPRDQAQAEVQVLFKEYGFQHTNYAFVKYLTEVLVASYHGKPFPVCISRPVSVGCIARSPAAGFVGNTSGATGIILSLACGVGDVMFRSPAGPYTVIPGDAVAGTIAASMAATAAGLTDHSGPHITQSCTSISNPLTLGDFVSLVCRQCRLDPPKREHFGDGKFAVRWGGGDFVQYQQARQPQIQQLVQSLEAEGRPRSASRVRTAWKVWQTWSDNTRDLRLRFDDTNVRWLARQLDKSEQDQVMIAFNGDQGMSWEQYISLYVRGAQQLYLHEAPNQALPLARL
eukprot:jgi/Astpho2/6070/fgenesh1_pg.00084_%23_59_t